MDTGQEQDPIEAFIARWQAAKARERANAPFSLTRFYDPVKRDHSPAILFPKEGIK